MSEFIGSRISLVSRSDIRYVGTLYEINSETSTVALKNVTSFGTEGRKSNPEEEIAGSDSNYDYIVFRGSDVKDLRIEEAPAVKENKPPQPPNDPAIIGSGSHPPPAQARTQPALGHPLPAKIPTPPAQTQAQAPAARQTPKQGPPSTAGPPVGPIPGLPARPPSGPPLGPPLGPPSAPPPGGPVGGPVGGPPHYPQHNQFPQQFYGPHPGQWGRGGPPMPAPGYPAMPYGVPPGWYPPPGQGFPPGNMYPYMHPPGPPIHPFAQQQKPAPIGVGQNKQQVPGELSAEKPVEPKSLAKPVVNIPVAGPVKSATPPAATKLATKDVSIAESQPEVPKAPVALAAGATVAGPKTGRIMPAVPLQSPVPAKSTPDTSSTRAAKVPTAVSKTAATKAAIDDATQAATAAVAAAMAKLPPIGGQKTNGGNVDNLGKKVKDMKMNEPVRSPRHPRGDGFAGPRGRGRGGHETTKFAVPAADFDFESANAKFNKQDLVKEAGDSSPHVEVPPSAIVEDANGSMKTPPPASYNKSSSFFDDLSSEIKDRVDGGERPGGRAWRSEEQKKNLETFGQGSVDNAYRGGYRGRGRGRGGMRGRGYGSNGQPGVRGRTGHRGRGDSQSVTQ